MRLLRIIYLLAIWVSYISTELSTRERIELHKAWLERRATLKALLGVNSSTTNKMTYMPKNIKLNSEHDNTDINDNKYKKYDLRKNEVLSLENNDLTSKGTTAEQTNSTESPISSTTLTPSTKQEVVTIESTTNGPRLYSTIDTPTTPYTTSTPFHINSSTKPTEHITTTTATKTVKMPVIPKIPLRNKPLLINQTSVTAETKGNKTNKLLKKRQRHVTWGPWEAWTECSRTCGRGVMAQTRQCINRFTQVETTNSGNRTSKDCIGLFKRYRICNEQSCPDPDVDFREQQCTQYNNQTFRGQKYEWEAYIKDDAECELNCKPIGMSYFATLKDAVIDGTPCTRPTDYLKRNYAGSAICVEGVCKAVHSSGVITGSFMNNGAVRCGSLICRPISGLFTKNPLPNGYVHVATIPIGASNISITEMKNSMNFLVLKYADQKFIINGDYSVSLSGVYEAAGAIFDYRRIDGLTNGSSQGFRKVEGVTEWITCIGPITEPVHLMVLTQEKNPGVKYEYLLPINTNGITSSEETSYENTSAETDNPTLAAAYPESPARFTLKSGVTSTPSPLTTTTTGKIIEKRKRKFLWKVVGFSPCNKSCGGGTQSPIIRCVRESPTRYFKPRRCAHLIKPLLNENLMRCNTQPCPAYWKIGDWSDCNCGNYNEEEHQKREIKCVQELGTGMVIQVPLGACSEEKPSMSQKCDCPKSGKMENYLHRYGNSIKNRGYGGSKTASTMMGNNSISKRAHVMDNKKSGVWLSSDWNKQCSAKCGDGIQYRSIFCDRSAPKTDRCDSRYTPDTTRQCTITDKCIGEWFVGPWSPCYGDCFNLTKSRSVYCIENEMIADHSKCNSLEKPITTEYCSMEEVDDCKPKWHYSDWTECSKKCGKGTQRRTIKCFEPIDGEIKFSDKCKYSERTVASRICNVFSCDTTTEIPDPRVDLIQNDVTPECKDELPNCNIVLQEYLCKYEYFKTSCCQTCNFNNDALN